MKNQDNIKEIFNSAIIEGVDGEAIASTLNELLNMLNESEITKATFREALDIIVEIKGAISSESSYQYVSHYMKENASKLIAALENGISSAEISSYLNNENIQLKNDVVNLIATLKNMDIKIKEKQAETQKNNQEDYQKVYVNQEKNN